MKLIVFDKNEFSLNQICCMIKRVLSTKDIFNKIYCFSEEISFINYIYNNRDIDIAIINISENPLEAIELAKNLYIEHPLTKIIFLGENTLFIEEIFEVSPLYFLLKPLDMERLSKVLNTAIKSIDILGKELFTINMKGCIYNIRKNLIEYIESNKRILTIYKPNKIFRIYAKMDDIEAKLGDNFIRCHQSFIVNMEKVQAMKGYEILLFSGARIPISKSKYCNTKNVLADYFDEEL